MEFTKDNSEQCEDDNNNQRTQVHYSSDELKLNL